MNDNNKEDIRKNGRLIMEFMEIKPLKVFGRYSIALHNSYSSNENLEDTLNSIAEMSRYHKGWECLMPVVEKIESINNCSYNVIISQGNTAITTHNGKTIICENEFIITKIESVYKTVVEFIKWYNKQNK
jgi:hypothetical protein